MPRPALGVVRLLLPVFVGLIAVALTLPGTASAAAQRAGIQAHLLHGAPDDADMDRQLDRVAETGAAIVRVDVGWQTLQEKGPGTWNDWYLKRVDRVVAGANARGIKPLFTLMWSPCWASSAPDTLKQGCSTGWWNRGVNAYAPTDDADYARAAAWLAARYRGRVAGWEIWNEPNLSHFWQAADPAGAYAELVKAAYPAIKAADPDATVLAGAISEADTGFAEQLFDHGIVGSFDAFSMHPYAWSSSPLDPHAGLSPRTSFVRGVPAMHDVMLRHGAHQPMWLSEAGWSTGTVRGTAWVSGVSNEDQARFVEERFDQVRRWDYVAVDTWYTLRDTENDDSTLEGNYGLLEQDGTPKPAFAAFTRAVARLQSAAPVAPQPVAAAKPPATGPAAPVAAAVAKPRPARPAQGRPRAPRHPRRLTVRLRRRGRDLRLTGTAPARATVRVRLHRRFSRRAYAAAPTLSLVVRVGRTGRFSRLLPPRMARGAWRAVATLAAAPAARGRLR